MTEQMQSRLKINMESGHLHETNISLPSYEMYQAELLDRLLLGIQHTEEAFIDVNNRIITNVNARKDRLNMINARIQNISARILTLYNQKKLMRITSPAILPKISTSEVPSNHPHQTVFFDRTEIMDLAAEIDEGAQPTEVTSKLPKLSSLTLQNKLYNTRLRNNREDLQQIISGATKHIHDITKLLLSLSKYRADTMGAVNNTMDQLINTTQSNRMSTANGQPSDASQEGILGQRPTNVTSVAELMLSDTNVNVYEDRQVNYIQETGAVFNIRGKKQKVLSKKEKEREEQQAKILVQKKAIRKAEALKRKIAAAPASFSANNAIKFKYATNEFTYTGAQQTGDVDIGLKEDLNDSENSGEDDDMDQFFQRNKKADQQKKMNMTQALHNAQVDHEMSMLGGNESRMDRTMQSPSPNETPAPDTEAIEEKPEGEEDAEGEGQGEGAEGEEGATATPTPKEDLPTLPKHDKNAMEDLAPAERLRINQAISKRELEERQRMIEEMIAAEKERDPDALDEDIRSKVNKQIALKKGIGNDTVDTMNTDVRKSKAPAIALSTVIAATPQQELQASDSTWKDQVFVSRQKTTRVGGPPKGPPPTGGRPGGPPKGPPPTGGRRPTTKAPSSTPAAAPTEAKKSQSGASNSNIPQAPPVSHFMAYLKGNYDPANPPSATGEAPRESQDLQFNPADTVGIDGMGQADMDDMKGMIDAIGGEDQPEVERSSIAIETTPESKPLSQMSLVEQLQAQAKKLKPAGATATESTSSGNLPEKRLEDMTLEEQLAYSASRLKKAGTTANAEEAPKAQPEKRLEDMTLEEQLAYSAARLKKPGASQAESAPKAQPEKRLEDMSLEEQLAYSASRLKKAGTSAKVEQAPKAQPEKRLEDMTLEEQLAYSAARLKKPGASAKPEAPQQQPEKRLEDMTLEEQLAYSAARLKKPASKAGSPKAQESNELPAVLETSVEHNAQNSRFMDSFRSDESMNDFSKIEESKGGEDNNPDRMTVIQEDPEEESRKTQMTSQVGAEETPQVKAPVIKQPAPAIRPSATMAPKTAEPATVLKKQVTSAVSQIKTSARRVSNIDRLKLELAVRQQTMNGGRRARMKDDSSDDNESSSDDSDEE